MKREKTLTSFLFNVTNLPKLITPFDMRPAEVLYEIQDLQKQWRDQNFYYTEAQKQRYAELLNMRHERVQFFIDNDMVQKGPKVTKKPEPPQEDQDS